MGWQVIGFGSVEGDFIDEEVKKIEKMFKDNKEKNFWKIDIGKGTVYFEMSGNKGIDYKPLEKIKTKILEMESHPFRIRVNEYSELDGGFYFDTEDTKNK